MPDPDQTPPPILDADRQEKAKKYARVRRRLVLVDLALGGLYLIAWLVSGLNLVLRDWVATFTGSWIVGLVVFSVVFALPYMLLDLPLSFYSGYILPHRYGQSNQTLRHWLGDQVKGLAVSAPLGLLLLLVVYWLLRAAPDWWWLYAGGVMLVFSVVLANLAPVLIAPLFYKFTPLDDEDLSQRLIRLAEQAGAQVQGVFRFDMSTRTKSANAALMGLGSTRRIVLGDTLLDEFDADEIETVLAHELGHHVHKDIALGIGFGTALTLVSFWVGHLALRLGVAQFGLAGVADPAGLPVLSLVAGVLGLIAMPLNNAYSRWRERMADRYALETTQKPQAFADAMTRIANQNLADADPERWVVILLHSHPPIQERVAAAQAFAAQQQ
jgi:STE24 endopeptidase